MILVDEQIEMQLKCFLQNVIKYLVDSNGIESVKVAIRQSVNFRKSI